jgi:acyl-coenzyme A synthetase/AMP-(fatty) acid ligase
MDGEKITKDGEVGELYVKSPGRMRGYLRHEDVESANKWLRSGDIGYCENSQWFIVDRAKDMIKVRGWQVSPAELESCLIRHPCVQDVAVVGIVCDDSDERPVAYVQARIQYHQLGEDLMDLVKHSLASYKALAEVIFVDSIPRTASGKVMRRLLKAKQPWK